jgi:5-formyltetrahydrofolate cyclo-ligase
MASTHSRIGRPSTRERRDLRRGFRQRRRALSDAEQASHAAVVASHFFAGCLPWRGRTIGAYVATDGELDPAPLLNRLLANRKRLALPVVRRDGQMDFYRLGADTRLLRNRFGILEPAPGAAFVAPLAIDLLLLPLVAFDDDGNRLGMGAGFYDRFLGRLPAALRPRLIGLAHACQHSPQPLPADIWDVPLDGVITEHGWRPFDDPESPWP